METETANKKSVQNSDLINIAGYSLQWSPFTGLFSWKATTTFQPFFVLTVSQVSQ